MDLHLALSKSCKNAAEKENSNNTNTTLAANKSLQPPSEYSLS